MRRSVISLVAGLFLAVFAVFLMTNYMSNSSSAPTAKGGMVNIVVAAQDLPFGSNVLRDFVQYKDWPEGSVPEGAFTNLQELLDDASSSGDARVVLRPIYAGEPILKQKVSGFGGKATLSRKVSEGKRAFSVSVNATSGVAGFMLPGDRVDIMLTRAATGTHNASKLFTDVILQNVEILGIDQLTDEATDQPVVARTVTFEVTSDQAQKLALAEKVGTLSMMLRGYSNNKETVTGRVTTGDLTNGYTSASAENNEGEEEVMPVGIRIRRGMSVN